MTGHRILSLRNVLGYKLPIQTAYAGDDDLSKKDQAALLNLSSKIELLNLQEHFDESVAGLQDGKYAMKPFAAIASQFRMTILVDAVSPKSIPVWPHQVLCFTRTGLTRWKGKVRKA